MGAEAEPGQSADDGLSGFGREVAAFNAACPDIGRRTLLLVDEFARTTNSREACALLSAVVELLGGQPDMLALVSTHFAGVARGTGTAVYRMRGFDRAAYDKYSGTAGAAEERLRAINRFMRYQLIDDDGSRPAQDALSVATALGLDPRLIALAQKNMEK